jgi:hypothetical protein
MPRSNPKKHSSPSVENQHPNTSGPLIFYRDRKKQKTAKSASNEKYRPMRTSAKQLPFLSRKERLDKLSDIPNKNDRNLQLILWELDCNYTLLEHQFVGVRRLAGLSENFPEKPLKLKVDETDGEEFDEALFDWTTKVLENAPIDERRGVLMGDEMGESLCYCCCIFILKQLYLLSISHFVITIHIDFISGLGKVSCYHCCYIYCSIS